MRRRLATLAAVSALALALGASPALAGATASGGFTGPMNHVTFDARTIGSAPCGRNGERVYTFTQGKMVLDYHTDAYDPSTDYLAAAHWTLTGAQATDQAGMSYRVVGGETYSDPAGRLNLNIMFLSPGRGVVDRATFVARTYSHGGIGFYFDFGTCAV
jgi:hypothetical protein